MKYLLDTDIFFEFRRRWPNPGLLGWIKNVPDEELFLSVITLAEAQTAIEQVFRKDLTKAAKLENWLDHISAAPQIIPITDEIIRLAVRWQMQKPEILPATALIAATATAASLMLVTANTAAFLPLGLLCFNPFLISPTFLEKHL